MLSIGSMFRSYCKALIFILKIEIGINYNGNTVKFRRLESSVMEGNVIWKLLHSHKKNTLATPQNVPDTSVSLATAT